MSVATLAADGSILIPEALREEMRLKTGDPVRIEKHAHGFLVLPASEVDLGSIPGLLRHRALRRPVSVKEMEQAVLEEAVARLKASGDE